MAKKSSINKGKNRDKLVKKFAAKRAALKKIIMKRDLAFDERLQAQIALVETAAQRLGGAPPQPLRADRPRARHVPQIQTIAHQIARAWLVRAEFPA